MGTQELQSETIESSTAEEGSSPESRTSYDIISFPAHSIPDAYIGMIYSRWLRSYRYGNFLFKMIDSDVYYEKYREYIDILLRKPDAAVRLAVLSDDHDIALGFCCHRGDILDYVHVHHTCRQIRIASHLVPEKIKCITHWTYMGERFVTRKYGRFTFNPFA